MKIGPRLNPAYAAARGESTPVGFIAAASAPISAFVATRVPIALFVVKIPSVRWIRPSRSKRVNIGYVPPRIRSVSAEYGWSPMTPTPVPARPIASTESRAPAPRANTISNGAYEYTGNATNAFGAANDV